ncbi:MAG: mannitol dehydrogenase family protein [Treponema sp.]|jgi:fructuronate reductase|nr:mannitol dehydrogenase family protein [Treponema sp.]
MRLTNDSLKDPSAWEKADIALPRFDRAAMIAATEAAPGWVHFGAGNIFRAFLAALQQTLLDQGLEKTGVIVAAGYDGEIIDTCFLPFNNLSLLVTLKADGSIGKQVIASIASALRMDRAADYEKLKHIFASPGLRMASLTITEKGYSIRGQDGVLLPAIAGDFRAGPEASRSYLGRITALCWERYIRGGLPLAMVSMDNCSHNGDKLFAAVEAFAAAWSENGFTDNGFLEYVRNPSRLSFPWSMIDKITPRPDDSVRNMLTSLGFEDTRILVTEKNSYSAPFVNAEETQYLVIEDRFPNGRPALEKAGVLFTDRETVDKVEKMKVCTCLNPLHTALAVFGCLLGYTRISEEMKDGDLVRLIECIGYREGLPVVTDPGIISPKQFIDQVIKQRFPNPFMPDTPQRIASDTSLKIPIRFGETLKAYRKNATLSTGDLTGIPLVLAAWLRYLLGVDDQGRSFTVSPDPLYTILSSFLGSLRLGQSGPFHDILEPVLSDAALFGLNLYEAGLGEKVEAYFTEFMAGPGAVRTGLKSNLDRSVSA